MLEGKALVVAIMMLTAAPLVVTDDGRAIVSDVTSNVTDIFVVEESAKDPKLDEVLDDAVDRTKEKDLELDRKDISSADKADKEEEKSCYYLEEVKDEMKYDEKDWDKEDKDWDREDAWSEEFAALVEACEEGEEESCEELEAIRDEREKDREEESEEEREDEEESEEREEGSRSGDEAESEEDNEKDEFDEELMAEMKELKVACDEGDDESCEELRTMITELMKERKDDIQLIIGDDGVVYYEDKEDKDWDEACLTMEEWKEVFEKDRKEKDVRYKDDRREMNIEDMMEMFEEIDEEEIAEIKQITNMSDEEWDQMIIKLETNNMTEDDWKQVMEKMKLVFEHEIKEEREEMEAFRAQMKEFDDACEAGNETACEELSAMMEEIEEDFEEDREDRDDKEDCEEHEEESEDESEEDESDDESDEDLE